MEKFWDGLMKYKVLSMSYGFVLISGMIAGVIATEMLNNETWARDYFDIRRTANNIPFKRKEEMEEVNQRTGVDGNIDSGLFLLYLQTRVTINSHILQAIL